MGQTGGAGPARHSEAAAPAGLGKAGARRPPGPRVVPARGTSGRRFPLRSPPPLPLPALAPLPPPLSSLSKWRPRPLVRRDRAGRGAAGGPARCPPSGSVWGGSAGRGAAPPLPADPGPAPAVTLQENRARWERRGGRGAAAGPVFPLTPRAAPLRP